MRHGLPVSDPLTLFIELGTILREDDLVAVGDALVLEPARLDPHDVRPWITLDALRDGCATARSHGVIRARRAAAMVRQGAESPMETALRLLIIRAGLPEPELNHELFDDSGRWIGRFDMVYRHARVIVEYDGDQHRTNTRQFDRDSRRLDDFAAHGWRVVRITGRSFTANPTGCLVRIRRALLTAGWRPEAN